jgi:uncharacterized protein
MIYIDLNELQRTNRLTSQDFVEPDEFNLDEFGINLKCPVGIKLEASHSGKADFLLQGIVETRLEQKCRKCLKPVERALSANLDLLFRSKDSLKGKDEIEEELQFDWKQGRLDLMVHLSQEIVLHAAAFVECHDACRGFCAGCGNNLNDLACECPEPPIDSRWEVLLNN